MLTNANISSDPQCHCGQDQEQHVHDIDRNAKVDSRQLAIGMTLDSLITPVPGFACEPCGAGQSHVMRTADDVASKGRVDESQPEPGRQDQSWLGTNAKKKKRKPGKRVQFQETGEIKTGTELSGNIGNPEAKVSAYPTDQRKRDKERKQAGVEVKRKPQHVEQHFDDGGEDFTPLLYNQVEPDNCESISDLDEQPDRMMSQYFGMAGSECSYGELHKIGALHHAVRVATNAAEFTKTWAHQAYATGQQSYDDVAELCGGVSGTVNLLVRRGYQSGPNFDLVCGYDLFKRGDRWYFFEYLAHCRPSVLIISTPCTGLNGVQCIKSRGKPRGVATQSTNLPRTGRNCD